MSSSVVVDPAVLVAAEEGRPIPTLPHQRDAEEAILGSVLLNPGVYFEIAQVLAAEDFFLHRNRWIWESFSILQEQRLPIDILTVSEELERQDHLSEAGGAAYLTALINSVPTSLHAVAYAKLVEEAATRRRLLRAANDIARMAYAADTPVEEVVNDAEKALFGVSERTLTHELAPIRLVLSEFYDRIDYLARHRDESIGVPTGFIDLDRLLGGMQPSDLLIIAGRPGQGKSGFCLSAAKNAAQIHKKRVALFSLEMSNEQLVQRLLAQETATSICSACVLGDLHDQEGSSTTQAVSGLSETRSHLDDTRWHRPGHPSADATWKSA
jgi:replicative DNA helicase